MKRPGPIQSTNPQHVCYVPYSNLKLYETRFVHCLCPIVANIQDDLLQLRGFRRYDCHLGCLAHRDPTWEGNDAASNDFVSATKCLDANALPPPLATASKHENLIDEVRVPARRRDEFRRDWWLAGP